MAYISVNQKNEYSLNALAAALWELMRIKPIDEITVTELCECAQVARKTFYRNCSGKIDLVDYMCEKQIEELLSGVDYSSEDYKTLYQNFFLYWKGRRNFLTVLLKQGLFAEFCSQFIHCCKSKEDYRFLDVFLSGKENQELLRSYHHTFLLGGLCQMLEQWTMESFQTPVEDIVCVLSHLVPEH